uniref:5-hydroxyisourate hydrolase n=1 Tax=Chromera velia CCMP2878 TaxID=1169474 RepID=A0A0G4ICX5_9ALVE|eukprot:Cvel_13254.t1-p1 / transcript=Cvel_13254.t1 / gene=Cvel_13254 / organism=Chromera_velia_CCMP2878 / gene_product=5-hydroxyisourate hydrolase, putative / transcript_product=5-hydroxyisourate hydrolase, putative / location=Cvel_scaffold898:58488-61448(+) / protein_length=141 / sequence_SO=supercontig / SO=protein_coding / is_pseudo=false
MHRIGALHRNIVSGGPSSTDSSSVAVTKMSSPITTHVLNTASGFPAAGMQITIEQLGGGNSWTTLSSKVTNDDGRVKDLMSGKLEPGVYRMTFHTGAYFAAKGEKCFYPECTVVFNIESADMHYHIPLLISPYGYSTYRGS